MAIITLREYQNQLNNLFASEAYDEVVGHCHHILQHYSKHVDTYRLLGNALLRSQHPVEATEVFRRILSAEPSDYAAHKGLSEIFEQQKNLEAAIWHMERIYDVYPNSGSVVSGIRRLYLIKDGREPDKVQMTRAALARQYMKGQLYDQAIAELNAALESNPQRYDLMVLLAEALYGAGYIADAGRTALEVLKHLPDCLPANALMVKLWLDNKRPEDAKPFLERVESLAPYQSAALIAPNTPVSDDAYRLERLDWRTQRETSAASTSPDWMSDLSSTLSTAGTGPLVAPDWYAPGADLTPAASPPANTPAFAADDMADWFGEIESGTSSLPSLEDVTTPPEPEPFDLFEGLDMGEPALPSPPPEDDLPLPDDALDWMADIPELDEPSSPAPAFELPDMDDLFAIPEPDHAPPASTGMTDFLSELNKQSDNDFDSLFDEEVEPEQLEPGRLTQLFSGGEFGETGAIGTDEFDNPQKASLTQLFDGADFEEFDDVFNEPETPQQSEKASLTQLFEDAGFEEFDDLPSEESPPASHGRLTGLFEGNDFESLLEEVEQLSPEPADQVGEPMDIQPVQAAQVLLNWDSDEDVPDWVREVDALEATVQNTAPVPAPAPAPIPTPEEQVEVEEPAWLHDEMDSLEESAEWLYDDVPQAVNEVIPDEQPVAALDADWLRDDESQSTTTDWMEFTEDAEAEPETPSEPEEKPAIVMPSWLNPVSEELPIQAEAQSPAWLRAPVEDEAAFENEPADDWLGVFGEEALPTEALAEENMSLSDFEPEPVTDDDDWMADFGDIASPEPTPEAGLPDWMNEPEPEAEPAAGLPDWMNEVESAPTDTDWMADFGETPAAEPAPSSGLPDWMNETEAEPAADDWMANLGESTSAEPATTDTDWMADFAERTEAEPTTLAEETNWLADMGELPQDEPTAPSLELPDWMQEPESADIDDKDWMADLGEMTTPPPDEVAETPDWMHEVEPTTSSDSDWMADFAETSQAESAPSSDLPDWMNEPELEPTAEDWTGGLGESTSAEPATTDTDWMADFAERTEVEPALAEETNWLADVDESEIAEPIQGADLPDWMHEPESADIDDKDWMADLGEMTTPPPDEVAEAPDWMHEVEAATSSDSDWMGSFGESTSAEAIPSSDIPDWLTESEAEPAVSTNEWSGFGESSSAEPVQTGDLPDWLSEMGQTAEETPGSSDWMSSPETEATAESGEAVDFSDWLMEDEASDQASGNESDWLSGFGEATETEAAPSTSAELPDWLAESPATEESSSEAGWLDAESEASDQAPSNEGDWLSGFGSATETEAAPSTSAELPDWLAESQTTEESSEEEWLAETEPAQAEQSNWQDDIHEPAAPSDETGVEEYTQWVGGLAHGINEEMDDMDGWISGLAQDVEVEGDADSFEPAVSQPPAPPPDMPEWVADKTVPARPTEPLSSDTPSWMTAFTDEEIDADESPASNAVAQAGDMVDNWEEAEPEEPIGEFGFNYDFENVKPAWLRGDNDDDSETQTFTPPWMRGK